MCVVAVCLAHRAEPSGAKVARGGEPSDMRQVQQLYRSHWECLGAAEGEDIS